MVTRERVGSSGLEGIEIAFDEERLVADAGLVLPATLCERLGAQGVIDGRLERPAPARMGGGAGAKALSVAFAMLAGADSIDDVERLRAGPAGGARPSPARGHDLRQLAARPGLRPGAPARRCLWRAPAPRLAGRSAP